MGGSGLLTRLLDVHRRFSMPRRPRLVAGDLAYYFLNRRFGRRQLF